MNQFFISPQNFDSLFKRFQYILKSQYGEDFLGFDQGTPSVWEAYKPIIAQIAKESMGINKWSSQDCGSGKILDSVIVALKTKDPKSGKTHNLVNWRAPRHIKNTIHKRNNLYKFEKLVFDFYRGNIEPDVAFNQFTVLIGKSYPLIAFLFYINDHYTYLPIAPTFFDPVFKKLNIDFTTEGNASWNNYCKYLSIIQQIQNYLKEEGYSETRLIDAHSFCWMVSNLDKIFEGEFKSEDIQKRKKPHFEWLRNFNPDTYTPKVTSKKSGISPTDDDYLNKHKQNMMIGRKAEEVVFEYEHDRLLALGKENLAEHIEWTSLKDNSVGYDIKSYNEDGHEIYIEVKAGRITSSGLSFFISDLEYDKSQTMQNYYFYCVIFQGDQKSPLIWGIDSKSVNREFLHPLSFLVTIMNVT